MGIAVKRLKLLKEKGYAFDIEGMLDAVDSDTQLFLIVTPNNPTGTSLSYAELETIADALPEDVMCRVHVVAQASAHPGDLVGGHASTHAAAAENDSSLRLPGSNFLGYRVREVGIVVRRLQNVGTQVRQFVALRF